MLNKIDHFAVGTDLLENGMAAMRDTLGVKLSPGGKHDLMSTHNCVMQAGNESFFELIAIDPAAPEPGRPRWFSLDDPATMRRLATRPRALCWLALTERLNCAVRDFSTTFRNSLRVAQLKGTICALSGSPSMAVVMARQRSMSRPFHSFLSLTSTKPK